jgi:plastocyanin
MADYTITLNVSGPSPASLDVSAGDKVTFVNNVGAATTVSFSGNSPFVPKADIQLASGASSSKKNVNGTKGTDTYDYTAPSPERNTRSGTIRVN